MKKSILFVMMLVSVAAVSGQNIFMDGTVWKVGRSYSGGSPDEITTQVIEYSLTKINSESGTDVFNLLQNQTIDGGEAVEVCMIKEEGNRVYFQQDQSDEWKILYDFNLKPGDEACVYTPTFDIWPPVEGRECTHIKCVSEDTIVSNGIKWPILNLDEYSDAEHKHFMGSGIWIKGIGSINGLIENCRFNYIMGMGSSLREVICSDEVVYSYSPSIVKVDEININGTSIRCTDKTISIYGVPANTDVTVCQINGAVVVHSTSYTNGCNIHLTDEGLYLVKIGKTTRKVLVR